MEKKMALKIIKDEAPYEEKEFEEVFPDVNGKFFILKSKWDDNSENVKDYFDLSNEQGFDNEENNMVELDLHKPWVPQWVISDDPEEQLNLSLEEKALYEIDDILDNLYKTSSEEKHTEINDFLKSYGIFINRD